MTAIGKRIISHWHLILLLALALSAFWIRSFPARYNELQGLDEFYLYRISETILANNFVLPDVDPLKNHPHGDTIFDYRITLFLPPLLYVLLNPLLQISFLQFALIYPAIMGAATAFVMYFLGKEIFNDRKTGLFAAFFMSVSIAILSRTVSFEKEASSAPFMVLALAFFVMAFRRRDWRYGILSGVMLGIMGGAWGGVFFIYALLALFALVILLTNRYDTNLLAALLPTLAIGTTLPELITPVLFEIGHITVIASWAFAGLAALRLGLDRAHLIAPTRLKYVTPVFLAAGLAVLLIGSLVFRPLANIVSGLVNIITFSGARFTTVAESIPGNWDHIVSQSSVRFAAGHLPELSAIETLFSLWFIGLVIATPLLLWMLTRKYTPRIFSFGIPLIWWILLAVLISLPAGPFGLLLFGSIPAILVPLGLMIVLIMFLSLSITSADDAIKMLVLLWLVLAMIGAFFGIRLVYFVGYPLALLSGFFCSRLIGRAIGTTTVRNPRTAQKTFFAAGFVFLFGSLVALSNVIFAALLIAIGAILLFFGVVIRKTEAGHTVFKRLHHAIVRTPESRRIDVALIPVVIFIAFALSANFLNAYSYAQQLGPTINQVWYDAMDFLRNNTPEGSSVLSWWDFGYWFQTRGNRPSIVDGSGVGAVSRGDVAHWFTDSAENWSQWEPILREQWDVDYILMDFSLVGKYSAITTIATDGAAPSSFLQFGYQPTNVYPREGKNIVEYAAGPYLVWLPFDENGTITEPPLLLASQNGQYVGQNYVNHICTSGGITTVGESEPSAGGCVALTDFGLFYLGPNDFGTIFSRLMFMDGAGLPLEKVFDNQAITIYRVAYE